MLMKTIKILGLLFLALIAIAIATCLWLNYDASKQLAAAKAALRESGAPMAVEALIPRNIPEDQNAAPLYQALEELESNAPTIRETKKHLEHLLEDTDYGPEAIYRFELSEEHWDTVATLLEQPELAPYFEIIDQITARQHFRPDWDYEAGPAMLIPEIGTMRRAAQWLLYKGTLAIRAGDHEEAAKRLHQTIVISEHAAEGLETISTLTSVSIRRMAFDFVEASTHYSNDVTYSSEHWLSFSNDAFWRTVVDMERLVLAAPVFEGLLGDDFADIEDLFGREFAHRFRWLRLPLTSWIIKYDYAAYLDFMLLSRLLSNKPYPDYASASRSLEEETSEAAWQNHHFITATLLPSLSTVRTHVVSADSRAVLTAIGLAINAYHSEHGTYPDTLDILTPRFLDTVPLDPFTGSIPIYRKQDSGFLLYSVGPNLKDEGGKTKPDRPYDIHEGDFVWTGRGSVLERPSNP